MRVSSARAFVRRWYLLLVAALAVAAVPGAAWSVGPTNVSGTISSDTTWSLANSPYVLTGNVVVAPGATLTIEPGVVVKLNDPFRTMFVDGTLKAIGTAADPIVFTSVKDDSAGGDTNGDGAATSPAPGQWYQILIRAGSGNELRHVRVRYGGYGSVNWGYGAVSVTGT